jgi:uncharacterized protein YbjT (DUF2867 family)
MKILVLGASGRTGKLILKEKKKRGHQTVAIVREPEKLFEYECEVIEGTPYDYDTVEEAIQGCDAVINTLNVSRKSDNPWSSLVSPKDLISASTRNCIKAMEKLGIKRFVALSTLGAGRSWKNTPLILRMIVSLSNLKYPFQDHGRQEDVLEKSDMDYTICRAPMLSDEINNKGISAVHEGTKPTSFKLSRQSAAEFFIRIIERDEYVGEVISLANNP